TQARALTSETLLLDEARVSAETPNIAQASSMISSSVLRERGRHVSPSVFAAKSSPPFGLTVPGRETGKPGKAYQGPPKYFLTPCRRLDSSRLRRRATAASDAIRNVSA